VDNKALPDLEHDIRATSWLCDKIRGNEVYAQNLYAALCNNEFQRQEVWRVLRDDRWSCTWRHAGGIMADVRGIGDYMDWYCSGMGFWTNGDVTSGYVPEGMITSEVRDDLVRLGWRPCEPDQQSI
jgi:hypothetical protein